MSFRGQLIKAGIDSNGTDISIFSGTLTLQSNNKLIFRDSGCFIHSNADGYLTIEADTAVVIAADMTITGALTYTGTLSIGTAAVGIDFTGTYTTSGIRMGTTGAGAIVLAANDDHLFDIYSTSAVASNSGSPVNAFQLYSTTTGTQSEDRTMSVTSYTDIYSGNENTVGHFYSQWGTTSGIGPLGMASAVTAKMLLPTSCTGAFFAFYGKLNFPTSPGLIDPSTPGNSCGWFMLSTGGESGGKTNFDNNGLFMEIHNLTAGAGNLLSASSVTMKCAVPAAGTIKYLMLSTTEDCLSFTAATGVTITAGITLARSGTGKYTDGILISGACDDNAIEITGSCTDSAIQTGTGTFGTGILLGGTITTGVSIGACSTVALTITGASADGIIIAGAMSDNGIEISGTCTDAAIDIQGTQTAAGLLISGTAASGISISGACSAYGLTITGTCTTAGIFLDSTNKLMFDDSAMYIRASADGHLEIVSDDTITLSSPGHGGIVFGGETDWGTGATGYLIDGSGWDWVTQTVGYVTSGALAAACAASYLALTVNATTHTTASSFFGLWSELYIVASENMTNAANVASVWGQVEIGASVATTDTADCFTAAIYANVKAGASLDNDAAHVINGVRAQLEVATSGLSNSGRMAAFECLAKSTTQNWDYGLYIATCNVGAKIIMSSTGATAFPAIDIDWTAATTEGTGGDLIWGTFSTDACVSVGDQATAATITGLGSHTGFLCNMSLDVANMAQYDNFGGFTARMTITEAQSVTDSIISGVTGYVRCNDSDGTIQSTIQAVRGMVWVVNGCEAIRQCAVTADILDQDATAAAAKTCHAIEVSLRITDLTSSVSGAIYIASEETTYARNTYVMKVADDNFTSFVDFTADGACGGYPAKVGSAVDSTGNDSDASIRINIDGVAYYIGAWSAGHTTNEA